jgi:hypothetical protein
MDIGIQRDILGIKGQRVNQIKLDEHEQQLVIHCRRDKRRNAIDPVTGKKGTVNRYRPALAACRQPLAVARVRVDRNATAAMLNLQIPKKPPSQL